MNLDEPLLLLYNLPLIANRSKLLGQAYEWLICRRNDLIYYHIWPCMVVVALDY